MNNSKEKLSKYFKKSFTLFLTIIIVGISTIILITYFQVQSFKAKNISDYTSYIQGQNHLDFLKDVCEKYEFEDSIEITNSKYTIKCFKKDSNIHYFIKEQNGALKLHEKSKI